MGLQPAPFEVVDQHTTDIAIKLYNMTVSVSLDELENEEILDVMWCNAAVIEASILLDHTLVVALIILL